MKQTPLELQKMEMMGRMSCAVIHDLNNMLTVIQLNAALLEIGGVSEDEKQKLIEEINRACNCASDLTRSVLTISRSPDHRPQRFEIGKIISELKPLLDVLIGRKTTLAIDMEADELWLKGSPVELQQIILNLVTNAMDAGPKDGVQLSVRSITPADQPQRFVEVSVKDTGHGISPEDLPQIFDPFFTTKGRGHGTGLGLDTVKRIVAERGGWIDVESTPGEGTEFFVLLPEAGDESEEVSLTDPSAQDTSIKATILLVEDDPGIRSIGRQILEKRGFQVLDAEDAEAARELWRVHQQDICLLFTDLILPGDVSGDQLATELLSERADLQVIYTSGHAPSPEASSLIHEGNFLQKPYRPEKLIQHVVKLLSPS